MLKPIIAQTSQSLHRFFDPIEINQTARETGFVQRTSKLDGFGFLRSLVLGFLEHPQASLPQLSQACLDLGVSITPQGVDERLNEAAVDFLRDCLSQALAQLRAKQPQLIQVLESFTEVYFQDSTIQSLPEGLQSEFAGSGGNASAAAVKIQLLFAFLSGNLAHVELTQGRAPDTSYQGHLPQLLPGSLLIQDLGFFNLETLQAVVARPAFFLTRWRQDVGLFESAQAPQSLDPVAFLKRQTREVADYAVYVGQKSRLPCRMIAVCLPERVAAERRRRVRADAQRRGTTASQRSLALCDWNVFLTNLPPERLSLRQMLACYSLRWQVELIFKLWKSQAGLKHLAGLRRERVLCELYAKLIGLVLTHFLVAPLRFLLLEQQVEISAPKARQILQERAKSLIGSCGVDLPDLSQGLEELAKRILRFARKNKRKMRPSSLDRLILANQLDIAQLYPLA
jgi:Transposase DDE domain